MPRNLNVVAGAAILGIVSFRPVVGENGTDGYMLEALESVVLMAYLDLRGSLLLVCCPRASFVA